MYGVINENIPYIFIYFLNIYSSGFFLKEKDNENEKEKKALSAGFEPAREDPNGFLVHRLNHSATTTLRRCCLLFEVGLCM